MKRKILKTLLNWSNCLPKVYQDKFFEWYWRVSEVREPEKSVSYQKYLRWDKPRIWIYKEVIWRGSCLTLCLGPLRIQRITDDLPRQEI